jgi:hypothetical protein
VLVAAFVALSIASQTVAAAEATPSEASIEQHIQALVPSLEDYISANMKSFDVPGLAIGVVAGNKLIYAKGFGARTKGGAPVDTQTLFQIGSTTKAARANNDAGIANPNAFAVVRLMTSSNFVGCSMGRSAGFAPRRILSTSSAARRNIAGYIAP